MPCMRACVTLDVLLDMRADAFAAFRALRREAAEAGDLLQVAVCDRAIDGDAGAQDACWDAIYTASAQLDEV